MQKVKKLYLDILEKQVYVSHCEFYNLITFRIFLFRVMEIQRIYEVTATPLHGTENWSQQGTEGASLSEEPGDRFIEQ